MFLKTVVLFKTVSLLSYKVFLAWLKEESGAIDSRVPDVTGTHLKTPHGNRLLLRSRVELEKLTWKSA